MSADDLSSSVADRATGKLIGGARVRLVLSAGHSIEESYKVSIRLSTVVATSVHILLCGCTLVCNSLGDRFSVQCFIACSAETITVWSGGMAVADLRHSDVFEFPPV